MRFSALISTLDKRAKAQLRTYFLVIGENLPAIITSIAYNVWGFIQHFFMETYLIQFVYYVSFEHQNTDNAPTEDKEWVKTYRIIPRVGDCVFKDGEWFQVERIFLYQPSGKGIDAQAQCSFYGSDKL